ncbi:MAG: hypothetical protein WCA27_09945 [Candidatus Sulfotelmatobacter sp.]
MTRFKTGATDLILSAIAATARVALGGPMAIWDAIREVAQKEGAKEAVRFFWESREAASQRTPQPLRRLLPTRRLAVHACCLVSLLLRTWDSGRVAA